MLLRSFTSDYHKGSYNKKMNVLILFYIIINIITMWILAVQSAVYSWRAAGPFKHGPGAPQRW